MSANKIGKMLVRPTFYRFMFFDLILLEIIFTFSHFLTSNENFGINKLMRNLNIIISIIILEDNG